jgi:multidrug transporter EmrE-like cation transporter
MSLQGLITIVIAATLTSVANLLLRAGITAAGGFQSTNLIDTAYRFALLLMEPKFAVGFVVYFIAALVWFRVIASEPLSIAYPVMVSLTFLMVTASAAFLFGERITVRLLVGLLLVLGGIALLAMQDRPA